MPESIDAEVLRAFARQAPEWLTPKMPDGVEAPYSVIRIREALLAGAEALERPKVQTANEAADLLEEDPIKVLEGREGQMARDLTFQAVYFAAATTARRRFLQRISDLERRVDELEQAGLQERLDRIDAVLADHGGRLAKVTGEAP